MMRALHPVVMVIVLASMIAGCTAPAPGAGGSVQTQASSERQQPANPKRITAAIKSDPGSLSQRVNPSGAGLPGLNVLQTLVGSGLSARDGEGAPRPHLAEDVPTAENGLWQVLADGRMETRWRIRQNALWHDGTPFTAADLVFTSQVEQDKELDIIANPAYASVGSIEAPDERTIVVRWRRPYIEPDRLFELPPFPKHLLERTYLDAKSTFGQGPYWTVDYVGTGPFRLREFASGSHVVLEANDRYALGRPKIDQIEVKFIRDSNALVANLLSGAVELTLGSSLSVEEGLQVREQWRDGRTDAVLSSWVLIWPQFINPNPPVIADLRFRRALLQAIDRQQLADGLLWGQVPVAHAFLDPNGALYRAVEPRIVRYPYDLRAATQAIEELGYRQGADAGLVDGAGQPLGLEIRASAGRDLNEKTVLAVADNWKRIGIATEPVVMPQQRLRDREYVQTFPGFFAANQPNDLASLNRHRSSQAPLPENNYIGNNNARYQSPEYDALVDRFFSTIPAAERTAVLGDIVHHMTDQLPLLGLFYNSQPMMIGNRLVNVTGRRGEGTETWNAHEWDVK
jgi:peptide/nickel transport system substrate-binding protein